MAKSRRQRPLPSTPSASQPTPQEEPREPAPAESRPPSHPRSAKPARGASPRTGHQRDEPDYLITGTGCTMGHPRGAELDAGRIGTVPTKKQARVGFGLVVWCLAGLWLMGVTGVIDSRWVSFGSQIGIIWLIFAAILLRRAGHQGKCWRTRTWRHAWGGLAPSGGKDPTREAGT